MRPPMAHAGRSSRPTRVVLDRRLTGPTGGRTIGVYRCGGAAPRMAAFYVGRGAAPRGARCAAAGPARCAAADVAGRAAADVAGRAACHAARYAADRPPATHRPNGRVAAPEPDLRVDKRRSRDAERRAAGTRVRGARRSSDAGAAGARCAGQPSSWRRSAAFGRGPPPAARPSRRPLPAAAAPAPTGAAWPARPPPCGLAPPPTPPLAPRRRPLTTRGPPPISPRGAPPTRHADAAPRPAARRPRGHASSGHRTGAWREISPGAGVARAPAMASGLARKRGMTLCSWPRCRRTALANGPDRRRTTRGLSCAHDLNETWSSLCTYLGRTRSAVRRSLLVLRRTCTGL